MHNVCIYILYMFLQDILFFLVFWFFVHVYSIKCFVFFVSCALVFFVQRQVEPAKELDKTKLWDNTKTTGLEKPESFWSLHGSAQVKFKTDLPKTQLFRFVFAMFLQINFLGPSWHEIWWDSPVKIKYNSTGFSKPVTLKLWRPSNSIWHSFFKKNMSDLNRTKHINIHTTKIWFAI